MLRTLLLVSSLALASVAAVGQCASPNFNAPANLRVGFTPFQLVPGDFNSDGKIDFAVPSNAPTLRFLLGNGTPMPTVFNSAVPSNFIAAADFNNDGKLDLLFAGASIAFHSNGNNPNDLNNASTIFAYVYRNTRP
jgi:hypothetical protein